MKEFPLLLWRVQTRWIFRTAESPLFSCRRLNYLAQLAVRRERRVGWQLIIGRACLSVYRIEP
jgi:hypothetical protein